MEPPRDGSRRYAVLLWAAAVAACYGVLLWAPLVYDDEQILLRNPLIIGPWPGWTAFFSQGFAFGHEYEPLSTMLHWALYRAAGERPFLYRLTSLLWHGLNCLLVWRLARHFLQDAAAAFWTAALFSLYPAHVEVLALSSFKKHLGVGCFGLLMLYVQCCRQGRWRLFAAPASFFMALLWKESAFMFLLLALLDAAWRQGWKGFRRDRWTFTGLALVGLVYISLRLRFAPRMPAEWMGGHWSCHILTSGKLLFWYLVQLVLPYDRCLEHSLSPLRTLFSVEGSLLLAGAALLGLGMLRLYRWDRPAAWGLSWVFLAAAPFLNLIPFLNYSLVADRYLYMASVGFFLALSRLVSRFARSAAAQRAAAWGLAALAIAYGLQSLLLGARFADPLALWSHTAACAPANPRAHAALGAVYLARESYPEAERALRRAVALDPDYLEPAVDLGLLYAETGRLAHAIELTEAALKKRPMPSLWNNLGVFHLRAGRHEQALTAFSRASQTDRTDDGIRLNLAACHVALGRLAQADQELASIPSGSPLWPRVMRLRGDLSLRRDDRKTAQGYYERSLAINPWQWEVVSELSRLYAADDPDKASALIDGFIAGIERRRALMGPSASSGRAFDDLLTKARQERLRIRAKPRP
ncbi:MAG: tetratricopeptide repeat protein [Elusimicrobia bacterium]|nr:tetratricopeptide repeat protein [Elusimicrobiota bacterium]